MLNAPAKNRMINCAPRTNNYWKQAEISLFIVIIIDHGGMKIHYTVSIHLIVNTVTKLVRNNFSKVMFTWWKQNNSKIIFNDESELSKQKNGCFHDDDDDDDDDDEYTTVISR